jgi:AAA+ superfamily predicted ATPase
MKNRIINYVKAGYPALYLVSHEELRMENLVKSVSDDTARNLYAWSLTTGRELVGEHEREDHDFISVLSAAGMASLRDNSILILRDYHLHLNDGEAGVIRTFKDACATAKERQITLIIIGAAIRIPLELSKIVTVVEFSLPDRTTLKQTLTQICETNEQPLPEGEAMEAVLDAAGGLTTTEAEDAFALSLVETGALAAPIIQREKSNTLKKNGLLELVESKITFDQIGGLEALKADLHKKRNRFTKAAREYGLPSPRGILAVGQPGTGKSLCATATNSLFGVPLIRLEASRLFGSLVGESEANWRNAFATAKAISPCVFWIDEVDGLFSGAASSGKTDGGTTSRVTKAIIQNMQYDSDGIFFMFTANDIDGLPDPLIDRVDVWNVELPHIIEREAIWRIHIPKLRADQTTAWNVADFNTQTLAAATDGFSGRQIEQVWIHALNAAFEEGRPPTTEDAIEAAADTIPTSKTMAAAIEARRLRLANARKASIPPQTNKLSGTRKISK